MPTFVRAFLLLAFLVLPASAQDETPPPGETPQQNNPPTEAGEEQRQHLLHRIEARRLIRELSDPGSRAAALGRLDELGQDAVAELLASKEPAAAESLLDLCRGWIGELSSDDFLCRDRAFGLLYKTGDACLELLKTMVASDDADLSEKAKLLSHMIDYRISPELYERLGHVMADYAHADWRERIEMIAELERLGGTLALPALKRILEREENPQVQLQAANSLIRVGTVEDLLFLKKIGLAEKLQAPAITAEIYLSQGIKYREAERYEEAIAEFKLALKNSPDDFRAHYEIAMSYLLSGKYSLSVTHFLECLKQQPKNEIVHYNLACSYSLMNDAANALKHLSLSIENGYRDLAHMEKDEDLANIRSDPGYRELVNELTRLREEEPNTKDENKEVPEQQGK
jgi:tetratricopeptide (TPR) repeat protein